MSHFTCHCCEVERRIQEQIYVCYTCLVRKSNAEMELRKLHKASEELQARFNFLRQPFNCKNADEVAESDLRILVQGREDEVLCAHKSVLVSACQVDS
jgi:hypothetical protein